MPAHQLGPDQGGREPSRPRAADRAARVRSALRKSAVRVGVSATLLAILHWGVPYLRHRPGLSAPTHSTISGLLAVSRSAVAIFMLAELSLLAGAVLTVRRPELHRRFVNLMFFWSYALVAPYLIIKSRRPPQHFSLMDAEVPSSGQPSRTLPATSGKRAAANELVQLGANQPRPSAATPARTSPAGSLPVAMGLPSVKVTREEYRKALQLLLQHTRILQQDRELLNLLLRQLAEPERGEPETANGLAHPDATEAGPSSPSVAKAAGARPVEPLPAAAEPSPSTVRREEYRKALQLLLQHTGILQEDRELLNLLLRQLAEPEHDERLVDLAQVRGPWRQLLKSSNGRR